MALDPDASPIATRCPFRVVVDTREQLPWHFTGITQPAPSTGEPVPVIVPLVTDRALASGDYSLDGFEQLIAVERKSQSDFVTSITAGRERFEREFERLAVIGSAPAVLGETPRGAAHVVVECDWLELLNLPETSQVSPRAIVGTVAAWSQRYGVHFWFLPGRRAAERFAFYLFVQWWRGVENERKRKQKS